MEVRGCNSVAYFRKMTIYNTSIDLFNDNVLKKNGLSKSFRSQGIQQKMNSDVNIGPLLCCKFAKK